MAIVKPFAAIRPAPELAAVTAALPYDVYHRAEAKEYVAAHPQSFLRIDRPETNFDPDFDMYSDAAYDKAAELLWQDVKDGVYVQEDKPCYYLYELTMQGRTQSGIVAKCALDDYLNGVILRHENTLPAKEADRIRHIDRCNAQTGPIFLTYRADETIRAITEEVRKGEALYEFTCEDGVTHRVFVIREERQIRDLDEAFAAVGHLYIADGHHRAASAVRVGCARREAARVAAEKAAEEGREVAQPADPEYDYLMAVLFPDEELRIMDYNRLVRDLNGLSSEEFFRRMAQTVEITVRSPETMYPQHRGQFTMYLDHMWYLCTFRDESRNLDPVLGLDVSLLQNQVLRPILGIEDPATDPRIDFIGGIRGLGELEHRCEEDGKVAFAMYPTSVAELMSVADAGRLMPPKSTWFEPKLRSGLFIHRI